MTKRIPLTDLMDDDTRAVLIKGLAQISQAVRHEGATVVVQGFGTFRPRQLGEREVRNPATGAKIMKGPSVSVAFRPSKVAK